MTWLTTIADELERRYPDGEILIETGASPSGTFHIGHIREWATGDAIALELRRRGRQTRLIHFIDDFDAIRKIPGNVPKDYEKYLGVPLCDVPAPDGSDRSYADYFTQGVKDACVALGIEMEFIESHKKYRSGWFVPAIEASLLHLDDVRTAITTASNRKLEDSWSPIQILESDGHLRKHVFVSIDTSAKTLVYRAAGGAERTVPYNDGQVKLDWRLDFPAHWWLQNVACEPSGRDHSTKGGSVDTGEEICRKVYQHEPPLAVPYDFINMVGDTKKMSASKGTGLDAVEGARILPAEVLRFFILRFPPSKRLYFDPINGVVQLMDEFAALAAMPDRTEAEEQLLYICTRGVTKRTVSRVPFSVLVNSYQAALKDADKTLEIISRTDYAEVARQDADIVRTELKFIDQWLERHAPEDVRFSLAEIVDASQFNDDQKAYLAALADKIVQAPANADGNWFHEAVYSFKDSNGLAPRELFTALYRAIINKDHGPRAGWFLSILPREWLVQRLRLQDAQTSATVSSAAAQKVAQLTDAVQLSIDEAVRQRYPQAAIGYLVADIPTTLKEPAEDLIATATQSLVDRGVSSENLSKQPEIAAWREVFRSFGVKASDYLSSAEALAKRALKGSPPVVHGVVDAYNAVSISTLTPMGAVDLAKLTGNLQLRYGNAGESADLLGMEKPVEVKPEHIVYADDKQVVTWLWNHRDAKLTAVQPASQKVVFLADSLSGPQAANDAINKLAAYLQELGVTIVSQGCVA